MVGVGWGGGMFELLWWGWGGVEACLSCYGVAIFQ